MTLNYSDGRKRPRLSVQEQIRMAQANINHEIKNKKNAELSKQKQLSFSNRGMSLEEDINISNDFYLSRDIAVIHKKPTPIQIVNVDYSQKSRPKINEAYFSKKSTSDYNGVYKGYYVDFEAKETQSNTSFPLNNIEEHQVNHMKKVEKQNGLAFFIIRFSELNQTYLLKAQDLYVYWDNQATSRKSIPIKYIQDNGVFVQLGLHPRIDYLAALEELYKESFNHN